MRAHLYELDMLRVVTAFAVVGVHVLAFTVIYNTSALGTLIQHGAEASLHFTREVFMFTTALVLVYTYAGKGFDVRVFARKRFIGVFVPYSIWSMIYLMRGPHPSVTSALPQFLATAVHDLITGNASFQLYYILLTLQFYMLFPALLWLLPHFDRHRWAVLGVSAALEVLILAVDYHVVQVPPFSTSHLGAWLNQYQSRFVLIYQFYFILGAICALHLDRIRTFALRHARLILAALEAALLAYVAHYVYSLTVARVEVSYAISVLQPIVLPFSVAVIAFLWWISCRWANVSAGLGRSAAVRWQAQVGAAGHGAEGARQVGRPRGSRIWRTLADASFGVYLVHPLFIDFAMDHVMPTLPGSVPEPLRVALVWLVAVTGSSALSIALMHTPILSRLVGRSTPLPPAAMRHMSVVWAQLRTSLYASLASIPSVQSTIVAWHISPSIRANRANNAAHAAQTGHDGTPPAVAREERSGGMDHEGQPKERREIGSEQVTSEAVSKAAQ